MSSVQLKPHLVKEMIDELRLPNDGLACLGNLLMAGKQTAVALYHILSDRVVINRGTIFEPRLCCVCLVHPLGDEFYPLKPAYLQKLALRFARTIDVYYFQQEFCATEMDGFVKALRENTNLKKVELLGMSNIKLFDILRMCPNLAKLDCRVSNFLSLLETTTIDVSNLRKINFSDVDGSLYPLLFAYLSEHPDRCPKLEKVSMNGFRDVDVLTECDVDYCVPSIKFLFIKATPKCCTSIDLSALTKSLSKQFPNLTDVTFIAKPDCHHQTINLAAYEQLYESFKSVKPSFAFKFDYRPDNKYYYFHKELEALASSKGTMDMEFEEEEHWRSYTVTTVSPNKVMTLDIEESDVAPADTESEFSIDDLIDLLQDDEDDESMESTSDDDSMYGSADDDSMEDGSDDSAMEED